MKFTLTITEASSSELANLLAMLGGSVSGAAIHAAIAPIANDDDDTSSDAPVPAGTVDKNGLPWDDRIHSTPASVTKKNEWRKRKGVSDALVAQVEAELRSRGPVQQPAPQMQPVMQQQPQYQPAPQQPMPQYQPAPQPQQPAPQYQPQPMPMQQQPAPQYQPAPQPQQQGPMDFNAFMGRVQAMLQMRMADGNPLVDAGYLANVATRIGQAFNSPVSAITDISGNQQMIDYAIQLMASENRWQ